MRLSSLKNPCRVIPCEYRHVGSKWCHGAAWCHIKAEQCLVVVLCLHVQSFDGCRETIHYSIACGFQGAKSSQDPGAVPGLKKIMQLTVVLSSNGLRLHCVNGIGVMDVPEDDVFRQHPSCKRKWYVQSKHTFLLADLNTGFYHASCT